MPYFEIEAGRAEHSEILEAEDKRELPGPVFDVARCV
jgi:hypothetical protein